jgi:hypothetical protein
MSSDQPKPVPPIQQVQRADDGTWHVAVTWSDGRTEKVGAFKTEQETVEWAHMHLQSWLEGSKARDNG